MHYTRHFILLVCVLAAAALSAQTPQKEQTEKDTTLTRNVRIERNYTPELAPQKRINADLPTTQPAVHKVQPNYSNYSIQLAPTTQSLPLEPIESTNYTREKAKDGFLRLETGVLWTWLIDFWYPALNNADGYFDLYLHHDGILTPHTNHLKSKQLFNTSFGFNFNKKFDVGQLYLQADYRNQWFNYYGKDSLHAPTHKGFSYLNHAQSSVPLDSILPPHQSLNRGNITLGFRSYERTGTGWTYDAALSYRLLGTTSKVQEHQLRALAMADYAMDANLLDLKFAFSGYFYTTRPYNGQMPYKWRNNAIVSIMPAYIFRWDNLNLRLGLKTHLSFNKGQFFCISPDVQVDYTLATIVNFYGGVTSDYHINSLWNVLDENRYYAIDCPISANTNIPIDIFAGFKVRPLNGLMIDANLHYRLQYNSMFYYNHGYYNTDSTRYDYSNTFKADYARCGYLAASARISYNYNERWMVYTKVQYNNWQVPDSIKAWHKPAWEISLGGEGRIWKGLSANAAIHFLSACNTRLGDTPTAQIAKIPEIWDLNLGANYRFKHWTMFGQINNLLGFGKMNYQNWYGYKSLGINILIGATIEF